MPLSLLLVSALLTVPQDVEVFTPPPYPAVCPQRLGVADLKARPADPKTPNLMLSQSDITAGVARGDPWVMLEAQVRCDYATADGAWTASLVSSRNPGLGQARFRQWQGGQVKAVSLGGVSGLSPAAGASAGRLHELYTIKQDADGGVLLLVDYPPAANAAVAGAVSAAKGANPG